MGREFRFTERKELRGCDEVQRIIIFFFFFLPIFFCIGRYRQLVRYDTPGKATWSPVRKRGREIKRDRERGGEGRGEERRGEERKEMLH